MWILCRLIWCVCVVDVAGEGTCWREIEWSKCM